ncbi:GtrA family protein [Companilactobacillus sp. DQM5]|uniref:GtrA family protein n=1 Tax=Companilactobacillus sp. DQM5 TaxID=3463359 RepID=UPI004057F657
MKLFLKYTVFGFLASIINVVIFNFYHVDMKKTIFVSNTFAWFVANLFSFFTSKHIVFKNNKHTLSTYMKELGSFFTTRGFSWIIDMMIMYVGIWIIPKHPVVVKIINQVLIGILNYSTSKLIFTYNNRSLIRKFKNR